MGGGLKNQWVQIFNSKASPKIFQKNFLPRKREREKEWKGNGRRKKGKGEKGGGKGKKNRGRNFNFPLLSGFLIWYCFGTGFP